MPRRARRNRKERVSQCRVRELQGAWRSYSTGEATLGNRGTRRVSECASKLLTLRVAGNLVHFSESSRGDSKLQLSVYDVHVVIP